jgi:trans-aconitate 2-methyltransferase
LQFDDERTRAARDLLARVPLEAARKIADVGCGPGNSTELLVARYPAAEILGVDSSPAMIAQARKILPRVRFIEADASTWQPASDTDLVFGNAVYHWIPDHVSVFSRLLNIVRPGAVLAVQMPDNFDEPTHRLMREVATDGPWARSLVDAARAPLAAVPEYYNALRSQVSHLEIWHVIYNHSLESPDAVVDWVSGTGLRPFIEPLSPNERVEFLRRYRARIADAYPPMMDGRVLLRFPRLFIIAVR